MLKGKIENVLYKHKENPRKAPQSIVDECPPPYRFTFVFILFVFQKPDCTDSVYGAVIPGILRDVIHQAFQGTTAREALCRDKDNISVECWPCGWE